MKLIAFLTAGLLTLGVIGSSAASESTPSAELPMVVTTDWLAEHLEDPDLVAVHIGPGDSFELGHLIGARHGSLRSLIRETETGIRDEMLATDDIAEELARLGIEADSRVIVYFSNEMASWAVARYVLTLEYAGFEGRVAYLDGGLPKWKAEGRPVTTDKTTVDRSDFRISSAGEMIVNADWLKARLGRAGLTIIDGRPPEGFSGLAGHWDRMGHIPGAQNIPFNTLMAEDPPYLLKSRDEIKRLFVKAGAEPGDTVVVYCGTGLWASQPYLAAKYAGYETRLYDGSFQEWASIKDLPVEQSGPSE